MRKVWISKDQLIPKPFYKRKIFIFFIVVFLFSVCLIIYQFRFINQLQEASKEIYITERQRRLDEITHEQNKLVANPIQQPSASITRRDIILGIRLRDLENYQKKFNHQLFKCLNDAKEISFEKINDNYCDCPDGSDETFTNACSNGKFYCTKQIRHKTGMN